MKRLFLIHLFLFFNLFAQSGQIVLDENFSDWNNSYLVYSDKSNDASNGGLDFGNFYLTNDNKYLYFSFEVKNKINLQSNNGLTLFIDTDFNKSTGEPVAGIGADLEYSFGSRSGTYWASNGKLVTIGHYAIGLVTSPTVTSARFEGKINLNSYISNEKVFRNDSIRIVLKDATGADVLPDSGAGVKYVLKTKVDFVPPAYKLKKLGADYLRIMAYNVHRDDLFNDGKKAYFQNIFKAIAPDIIGLEEVYKHSAQQAKDLFNSFLPLNNGSWYAAKTESDVLVVSKFPILSQYSIDGNAAFLLDLQKYKRQLLLVVAHPPCCNNDAGRQKEIDHIMAFIRDAKNGVGKLSLPTNSPIVIEGDMNFVGDNQQVKTLLEGDIINENTYGQDFKPDWDGSAFEDAKPITTGLPATFTWLNSNSPYPPGRLDYQVFTGSVMTLVNSFALFTPELPQDSLTAYGLQANDVTNASDHLPIVSDFKLSVKTSVGKEENPNLNFKLLQNYPNPVGQNSSEKTTIQFVIPHNPKKPFTSENKGENNTAILKVFNLLGQTVSVKIIKFATQGAHSFIFDASSLPSGVYFYSLIYGQLILTKKMIVIH